MRSLAIALILSFISTQSYAIQGITVEDLGMLDGNYSKAFGNANRGVIAGTAELADGRQSAILSLGSNSPLVEIGFLDPSHINSSALGANNRGHVVGYSTDYGNIDQRAFLYHIQTDTLTALGTHPTHTKSSASDINDDQIAAGSTFTPYQTNRVATRWLANGTPEHIYFHATGNSYATAINQHGNITGYWEPSLGMLPTSFVWNPSTQTSSEIALPPQYNGVRALDISNLNVVCGQTWSQGGSVGHGFVWSNGRFVVIDAKDGYSYAVARAINNSNMVIGWSGRTIRGTVETESFVWDRGTRHDMSDILLDSQWSEIYPQSINDRGEIVGYGKRDGDQWFRAIKMTIHQ